MVRTSALDPYLFDYHSQPSETWGNAFNTVPWVQDVLTQAWILNPANGEGVFWRFPLQNPRDKAFMLYLTGRAGPGNEGLTLAYSENSGVLLTNCTAANPMVCSGSGIGTLVGPNGFAGYASFPTYEGTGAWLSFGLSNSSVPVTVIDANTVSFTYVDSTSWGSFTGQVIHLQTVDTLYNGVPIFPSPSQMTTIQVAPGAIPSNRAGNGKFLISTGNQGWNLASMKLVPTSALYAPYALGGANADLTSLSSVTRITNPGLGLDMTGMNLRLSTLAMTGGYLAYSGAICGTGVACYQTASNNAYQETYGFAGVKGYATGGGFPYLVTRSDITGTYFPIYNVAAAAGAKVTSNSGPFLITTGSSGSRSGTGGGTFFITGGYNDTLKITIDIGTPQVFVLPPGSLTPTAVVAALAGLTGGVASASGASVWVTSSSVGTGSQVLISSVTHDAAGTLGFTEGSPGIGTNSNMLTISVNGGGPQTFFLTTGSARTAAQVISDLGGLTGATLAVVGATFTITTVATGQTASLLIGGGGGSAGVALGIPPGSFAGGLSGLPPTANPGATIFVQDAKHGTYPCSATGTGKAGVNAVGEADGTWGCP